MEVRKACRGVYWNTLCCVVVWTKTNQRQVSHLKRLYLNRPIIFFTIIAIVILSFLLLLPHLEALIYPQHYSEEVFLAADEYNLDPYLLFAIIKVESKFNPDAVSEKGALGLMQVMPKTGTWVGAQALDDCFEKELLLEPGVNIRIGAYYIAYLLSEFEYDLSKTLAAYNAGQGNVKKWLDRGVWDGSLDEAENIPYGETREYLEKVLSNYQNYKYIYVDSEAISLNPHAFFERHIKLRSLQ